MSNKTDNTYLLAWGPLYKNAFPVSVFDDKAVAVRAVEAAGYKYNETRDCWVNDAKQQYVRILEIEYGTAKRI